MRAMLFAGLVLVELHGPQNQLILVNPSGVTAIREPRVGSQGHFAVGTHCLLVMANGDLISTREHCDEVRTKLEAK
jgi:hypothetical protein